MGRLIDADDAINVFANRLFEMLKTHSPFATATERQIHSELCYKVAEHEINNIPTAYDVEKVVATAVDSIKNCDDVPNRECMGMGCDVCKGKRVENIIRKGGVNE